MDEESLPVSFCRIGVYPSMTLPAEAHKVRKAECYVFVFRAAHALGNAVMNIAGKVEAALAKVLIPLHCLLAGAIPVHS